MYRIDLNVATVYRALTPVLALVFFFFKGSAPHRDLPFSPTRPSPDLLPPAAHRAVGGGEARAVHRVVQRRGGVGAGPALPPGPDPDEVGQQAGAGRPPRRDAQLPRQV